jgi:hypothetical protein
VISEATPDFQTSPPLSVGKPSRSSTPFHVFASDTLALSDHNELHSMTDAAAEPLISHSRDVPHDARDQYDHEEEGEEVDEDEVDESRLVSPGLFIWGLTICAGVSGLLFGFEYVSRLSPICTSSSPSATS